MKHTTTLAALALLGGLGQGLEPPSRRKIRVVENPKHTRNLFGSIDEIAGKVLEVFEKNEEGDCMCIFTGSKGQNLVDVDHRDIDRRDIL